MLRAALINAFYWTVYAEAWLVARFLYRVRPRLPRIPPRGQPFLLVANHVSGLDPVFVATPLRRRTHFMATAALFDLPVVGTVLGWLGAFPKQRRVKDRESAAALTELYGKGHVIGLFPEGTRSWDGRTNPMRPGLGRLVKRLDATVICARIRTGHLAGPRWATHARWVPVEVEYTEALRWPDTATAEEIEGDIAGHIRLDVEAIDAPRGSWGRRLAHGLPDYLWACPACSAVRGIALDGDDRVRCGPCGEGWRVDLSARLHPDSDGPALTVARAHDRAVATFGTPPVLQRPGSSDRAYVLWGASLRLTRREGKDSVTVAEGPGGLTRDALHVGETELPLTQLHAVVLESASRIFLRTEQGTLQLHTGDDPPAMWQHFLEAWVGETRPGG